MSQRINSATLQLLSQFICRRNIHSIPTRYKCVSSAIATKSLNNQRVHSTNAATLPKDTLSTDQTKEKATGQASKHEFQAETRMLLDIVARSLYSDKEVFVRELISNASDALEKFRYLSLSGGRVVNADRPLEIHISTDKQQRILSIQDTGIGMSQDELKDNLGVIAHSGSKAFLEQLKKKSVAHDGANAIIGQFGVGFYSAFMVADTVEVFSRSSIQGKDIAYRWYSDGTGTFQLQHAEGVDYGTKVVLHLKTDCREFSDEDTIKNIIKKYSNFVGSPIYLNKTKVNTVKALWMADPKSVSTEQHTEFYRFLSSSYDIPRYTLHYTTDVPISIHALLYFPEGKPGLFEIGQEVKSGVALYAKKILIKSRTDNIIPKWLRFVKGVVDSEDIPLNLSRELLQNSPLIRKLNSILTNKIVKFLQEQQTKDPDNYDKFYTHYGIFIKEGIITGQDQAEKEEAAKLLQFESSHEKEGKKVTLTTYLENAKDKKGILYLAAPSRALAEASPYYESLKNGTQEVLFCYEPYDELALLQLQQFKGHKIISVEKDLRQDKASSDLSNLGEDSLKRSEITDLSKFMKQKLTGRAFEVSATTRLDKHPCVVTVEEMAAARHFIRAQSHQLAEDKRYAVLQPTLELNPKHPIIKKLHKLISTDPELATLLTEQLFANAMVGAGLVDDSRFLLTQMNDLLTKVLEKH